MKIRVFLIAVAWTAISTMIVAQAKGPVTGDKKRPNPRKNELSIALTDCPISERIWNVRDTSDHEDRVTAALDWLADHQALDGCWDARRFPEHSKRIGAERTGNVEFYRVGTMEGDLGWDADVYKEKKDTEIGLTGLAVMAFTAAGYSHLEGPYREELSAAVSYLLRHQAAGGMFGDPERFHHVYQQSTATIALAELYAISGDRSLRIPVEEACIWLIQAQSARRGGWRYEFQEEDSDTSATGFALFALMTAESAGITVRGRDAYDRAREWLDLVTVEVQGSWKTGYNSPGSNNARFRSSGNFHNNACMDGVHGMARLWFDHRLEDDDLLQDFVDVMLEEDCLPQWSDEHLDTQYWWWCSLFLRQLDEDVWSPWRDAMEEALIDHQRGFHKKDKRARRVTSATLDEHGSWDPVGAWGIQGGRVYSTAMGAILLGMDWR